MVMLNSMQSNYRQYFLAITAFGLSIAVLPVQADSLKSILKTALVRDPILLEAKADEEGSYNRVEQAKSLHYPKVRLTGNSTLVEKHKNKSSYSDSVITPGLEVSLNLYSFGAINAEVEKNEFTKQYYGHKYHESREELGYTIGDLYLTAYDAKQSIKLLRKSLKRHKRILGNMKVIVDYDRGRQSEYVQAKARQILVVQQINDTQRLLDSSLSRLSKYTGKTISETSLQNPFKGLTRHLLKKHYTLTEKGKNPTFLAQKAQLDSKIKDVEAEKAKQFPSVDLVGYATPDDQQVGLRFSWDVFNRATTYTVKEKNSLQAAAKSRLQRVLRDIEEAARLAIIEMKRSEVQLKTLKAHAKEARKVVEFYKLQFSIARRSLIEVLNAEKELTDVELAQSNTQTQWNRAALSYLQSQGKIADWVGLSNTLTEGAEKNKVQFVDNQFANKKPNKQLDKQLNKKKEITKKTDNLLTIDHLGESRKPLSNTVKTNQNKQQKITAKSLKKSITKVRMVDSGQFSKEGQKAKKVSFERTVERPGKSEAYHSLMEKRGDKVIHLASPEELVFLERTIADSVSLLPKKGRVRPILKKYKLSKPASDLVANRIKKQITKMTKPIQAKPIQTKPVQFDVFQEEQIWEDGVDGNIIKRDDKPKTINLLGEVDSTVHFKD